MNIFIIRFFRQIIFGRARGLRSEGHVACMGVMRTAHKILVGQREGKWPLNKGRRLNGISVLKWAVKRYGVWIHMAHGPVMDPYELDNEPSDSMTEQLLASHEVHCPTELIGNN